MNLAQRRLLAPALAVLVALPVMAATACSNRTGPTGKPPAAADMVSMTPSGDREIESVRWLLGSEPSSIDWIYSYDYPPNSVLSNVCESLLRIDADFTVQPNLAEKVTNPDPLTYVYSLRQGVTFHDGTPMTADDVVFSLKRHMDPGAGSYWATAFARVKDVAATGTAEVTVKLSAPDALFNQMMAVVPGIVESKAYVTAKGKNYGGPDGGVGCTGPFQLSKWTKGQSITLTRAENYWDPTRKAKAKSFELVIVSDPTTQLNALTTGEVDGTYGPPVEGRQKLLDSGIGKLYFGPTTSTVNFIVNDFTGPLKDVRIRKALWLAIDREGLIKAAYKGRAEASRAVAAKLTWGGAPDVYRTAYDALPEPKQNLDQAKQLVAEVGAPAEPIVVAISSSPVFAPLANEMKAAGERIGLKVELKTIAPDQYGSLFGGAEARKDIDLFFTSWYADIADALQIYQNWESKSFANYGKYSNPQYDELYARALSESDPVKRAELVVQLQKITVDDMVWLPIVNGPNSVFMNNRISGAPATNAYLYYPWAAQIGGTK
ncbi:ABC transporter substrate-binding protein [Micromonospora phytophila]|uniref:ABC transporter substrate-binding protein n=1 Tax=Micromonospora phytophila TaxID=709888 RepID=UPI00202F1DFD|nr:ABC transporter substrate-binding protein [Micromonospora phytophila]MCM0673312.1 ABC transporter substrate-binding protein [Micromonospora phytophila]